MIFALVYLLVERRNQKPRLNLRPGNSNRKAYPATLRSADSPRLPQIVTFKAIIFYLDAAPGKGHYRPNPELLALPQPPILCSVNVWFGTGVLGWAPVLFGFGIWLRLSAYCLTSVFGQQVSPRPLVTQPLNESQLQP